MLGTVFDTAVKCTFELNEAVLSISCEEMHRTLLESPLHDQDICVIRNA
jgi:hypothetical protein